jgi:hypothetical protein
MPIGWPKEERLTLAQAARTLPKVRSNAPNEPVPLRYGGTQGQE